MTTIKYDTIKTKAIREFEHRAGGVLNVVGCGKESSAFLAILAACTAPRPQDPHELLKTWIEYGRRLIQNWDVRVVKRLIELFPSCVPKHCAGLPVQCEFAETGWVCAFG